MRKVSQIRNIFRIFSPGPLKNRIGSFADTHYTGKDEHMNKLLKYLSVGEHIRWEASHVALGYNPGAKRDVLLKVHEYIKDYDELDPVIQHYDYLDLRRFVRDRSLSFFFIIHLFFFAHFS